MNLISEDDACPTPSPACVNSVTIELATIGKAIINEQK